MEIGSPDQKSHISLAPALALTQTLRIPCAIGLAFGVAARKRIRRDFVNYGKLYLGQDTLIIHVLGLILGDPLFQFLDIHIVRQSRPSCRWLNCTAKWWQFFGTDFEGKNTSLGAHVRAWKCYLIEGWLEAIPDLDTSQTNPQQDWAFLCQL